MTQNRQTTIIEYDKIQHKHTINISKKAFVENTCVYFFSPYGYIVFFFFQLNPYFMCEDFYFCKCDYDVNH